MRERPLPSGVEFIDDGQSRKRVVMAVLAASYVGLWAWLWSRHHLWAVALGLLATVVALSIYRFIPTFLVRLDAERRECLVEWKIGPFARRRVIPFDEIAGIARTGESSDTVTGGEAATGSSRLEFLLRDGSRMPWTDYHSSAHAEQDAHRSRAMAVIHGDVAGSATGG